MSDISNDPVSDHRAAAQRRQRWNRATALLMPKLGAFAQALSFDEQWVLAYLLRDAVPEGDDAPLDAADGPISFWPQPNSFTQQPKHSGLLRAAPHLSQSNEWPGQRAAYGADESESADFEKYPCQVAGARYEASQAIRPLCAVESRASDVPLLAEFGFTAPIRRRARKRGRQRVGRHSARDAG